jgi:hypothetical protein
MSSVLRNYPFGGSRQEAEAGTSFLKNLPQTSIPLRGHFRLRLFRQVRDLLEVGFPTGSIHQLKDQMRDSETLRFQANQEAGCSVSRVVSIHRVGPNARLGG